MSDEPTVIGIGRGGYPALRQAFNRVLKRFAGSVTADDVVLAQDILELDDADLQGTDEQTVTLLIDVALFSASAEGTRAIDRLAAETTEADPVDAAIAGRLPHAFFSVFEVLDGHPEGGVRARDLVAGGPEVHIMDEGLAANVAPGALFAGRFVAIGPWHVGFGVVSSLARSEVVALMLAADHPATGRTRLHEIVYRADIHGDNLAMHAVEPLIATLSDTIDASTARIDDVARRLAAAFGAAGDLDSTGL